MCVRERKGTCANMSACVCVCVCVCIMETVRGSVCVPVCARKVYPESKMECGSVCMSHGMNALHFNCHFSISICLYFYYYSCSTNHSV